MQRGKMKRKPRAYGKTKDAPDLLKLLDLNELKETFEDVNELILYIESKK
jgi:hypothetical protein